MTDEAFLATVTLVIGLWMILKPPERFARNMLHPGWTGLSDDTRRNLLRLLGLILLACSFVVLSF